MNYGTSWLRPFIIALAIASLTISCAERKQESAQISLNLSSANTSLDTKQIDHVVVNFRNQLYEWDCDKPGDCDQVSFTLESNQNGLLQLLVITEDSASPITEVNYGSVATQFKPGENTIKLPYKKVADFQNEARIFGRYIPGTFQGSSERHKLYNEELTGLVTVFAQVDLTGKEPDMKVATTEIFGGWLEIFALQSDDIGFKYKFTGYNKSGSRFYQNEPILNDLHDSKGLDLDSQGISFNSNKIMHYFSTDTYFDQDRNNRYYSRPFPSSVIGFFGRSGSKTLCSETLSDAHLFDGEDDNDQICRAVNADESQCTSFFQWGQITRRGAIDGSSDTCTGSVDEHEIDIEDIGENHSRVLGFYGPFIKNTGAGQDQIIKFDKATGDLSWLINSGANIDGVDVLTRRASQGPFDIRDAENDGGFDCQILIDKLDFKVRGNPRTEKSATINLNSLGVDGPGNSVALCPRKPQALGGGYFEHAIVKAGTDDFQQKQKPLVEFAAYQNLTQLIPGRDFGQNSWNSQMPIEFQPVNTIADGGAPTSFFLTIKNLESEAVNVALYLDFFTTEGLFQIDPSPASTPDADGNAIADPACGGVSFTLSANDLCVVEVIFDQNNRPGASTPMPGGTNVANFLGVYTELASDSERHYFRDIRMLAFVIQRLHYMGGTPNLDFFAPIGKSDIKYLELYNDSGGPIWNVPAGVVNASLAGGRFQIERASSTDCPTINIPDAGRCLLKYILNNPSNSPLSSEGVKPNVVYRTSLSEVTPRFYFEKPSLDIPNHVLDFQDFSDGEVQTVTITNNSAVNLFTGDSYFDSGNAFSLTADSCQGSSLTSSGGTCALDFTTVLSNADSGFNREYYTIPYSIGGSTRLLNFEVVGSN